MESEAVREAYATVGELILIANTLDHRLNKTVCVVLDLGDAAMLEGVIATIDTNRKIEILKEWAKHFRNADWRKTLTGFLGKVEDVMRERNVAAHSRLFSKDETWVLRGTAAAKVLKRLHGGETALEIPMARLRGAISKGEAALAQFDAIHENFARVHAARRAKFGQTGSSRP